MIKGLTYQSFLHQYFSITKLQSRKLIFNVVCKLSYVGWLVLKTPAYCFHLKCLCTVSFFKLLFYSFMFLRDIKILVTFGLILFCKIYDCSKKNWALCFFCSHLNKQQKSNTDLQFRPHYNTMYAVEK